MQLFKVMSNHNPSYFIAEVSNDNIMLKVAKICG